MKIDKIKIRDSLLRKGNNAYSDFYNAGITLALNGNYSVIADWHYNCGEYCECGCCGFGKYTDFVNEGIQDAIKEIKKEKEKEKKEFEKQRLIRKWK